MKFRYSLLIVIAIFLGILTMGWLTQLPDNSQRSKSHVIKDGLNTSLGQIFSQQLSDHQGLSGVYLLRSGLDAFVGRVLLARKAEKSLDVQYYMFHQDTVGRLLISELLDAADRGVRVRLLVDDMYGSEADDVWLALNSHPLFEVRLFNPFVRGHSKNLQFITRVKEVNHRMHSKSFTADNQATIVGGRNIGDEYFSADPELAFTDRDVMAIGPVVPEVSEAFDQYWNNQHAFPMTALLPDAKPMPLERLRQDLDNFLQQNKTSVYIEALENSSFADALRNNTAKISFAKAVVVHDSPDKMDRGKDWKDDLLMSQLAPYILESRKQYILVSPYFVPGERAAEALCEMSGRGVQVSILTNSLASNDVAAVHTGYIRHRKQLLRCGVTIYELNEQLKEEEKKLFSWLPGLSKSSLHAKNMSIDHQAMFVGSFNFDQRSLFLNNEIGILFYEPELAREAAEHFEENIEKFAFRVELMTDDNGKEYLRWSGKQSGKVVILFDEPYATSLQKAAVQFMRLLPIDSML